MSLLLTYTRVNFTSRGILSDREKPGGPQWNDFFSHACVRLSPRVFCSSVAVLTRIRSGGGGGSSDATTMGDSTTMGDAGASDVAVADEGFVTTPCVTDDMCPADQYCRASEGGQSICAFGCREGGCDEGRRCDLERRNCVRDLRCATDEDCFGGEYCNEGECADGCRVGNEDDCPRDDEGRPRTCDPATHTCALQVVCCGEDNACSLELPENCATPLEGERGCFNPNPCRLLCEEDADCEAGLYCNGDGRCVEGCRLTGVSGCRDDRICDADSRECIRPPCGVDDDCPNDMFCQEMECLPGCRVQPDNCRRGEYCDPDRRRCLDDEVPQDCRSDEQCAEANGPGWFCDGQDCQPPCANHGECPAGKRAAPTAGVSKAAAMTALKRMMSGAPPTSSFLTGTVSIRVSSCSTPAVGMPIGLPSRHPRKG